MFQCPQCATELPADASVCPCCGKTFLSTFGRSQSSTLRKVTANLKAKQGKKSADEELEHPLNWRTIVGGAAVFLFIFAVVGYTMKASVGGAAANPWVDADGKGRVSKKSKDADLREQITFTETQLLPSSSSIEAIGEFTNGTDRTILQADLQTTFRAPSGVKGPARGVVRMVAPGQTVSFKTYGSFTFDLESLRSLSWHTELADVAFAPVK